MMQGVLFSGYINSLETLRTPCMLRSLYIGVYVLLWSNLGVVGDDQQQEIVHLDLQQQMNDLAPVKPWMVDSGPWLQEFEEIAKNTNKDLDYLQGDDPLEDLQLGPGESSPLKCPDAPEVKNLLACSQPACEDDSDCLRTKHKCCDNGCVQSCVRGLRDSPVIDWQQQPLPQPDKESSWLIPDPDDTNDANGVCFLEGRVIPEGVPFQYEGHPCVCESGEVDCDVWPQLPEI